MIYVLALLIGVIAGLRAMTAPAAISWAAYLGWIDLQGSWLSFLGHPWAPWIISALALAELVTDQLPATPSRKVPMQFIARILSGALCGAAIGYAGGFLTGGAIAGAIGAIVGTLGGASARSMLASALGGDRPAALIEDIIAIGGAVAIVTSLA